MNVLTIIIVPFTFAAYNTASTFRLPGIVRNRTEIKNRNKT